MAPADEFIREEDLLVSAGAMSDLLTRLPPDVLHSFTAAQRAALWEVGKSSSWRRHPVNIRLSLPLIGSRLFMTVVAGIERRSKERIRRERRLNPLTTIGNILFFLGVGTLCFAASFVLLVIVRPLIDY